MFQERKPNPEVPAKTERRRFNADYKRRMILEAEKCGSGQLGSLLRREGLTYTQLSEWRKAYAEGRLSDKRRGPQAGSPQGPNRPASTLVRQRQYNNSARRSC